MAVETEGSVAQAKVRLSRRRRAASTSTPPAATRTTAARAIGRLESSPVRGSAPVVTRAVGAWPGTKRSPTTTVLWVSTRAAGGLPSSDGGYPSSRRGLARTIELLGQVDAQLVGTVLNLVPRMEGHAGQPYRYETYRSRSERRRKHTRRTEGARASVHPAYVSSNGQGTSPADDRETAPASPSGHRDTPWPAGHEGTTPMAGPHEPPPPGEHPGTTFQADRHEPSPTPAGGREAPSVADRDTLPPPPDKDLGPTHLSPTIRCTPPRGSGGARPRKPTTSGNTSMTRRAVVG